jgi:hypothetical protein
LNIWTICSVVEGLKRWEQIDVQRK